MAYSKVELPLHDDETVYYINAQMQERTKTKNILYFINYNDMIEQNCTSTLEN